MLPNINFLAVNTAFTVTTVFILFYALISAVPVVMLLLFSKNLSIPRLPDTQIANWHLILSPIQRFFELAIQKIREAYMELLKIKPAGILGYFYIALLIVPFILGLYVLHGIFFMLFVLSLSFVALGIPFLVVAPIASFFRDKELRKSAKKIFSALIVLAAAVGLLYLFWRLLFPDQWIIDPNFPEERARGIVSTESISQLEIFLLWLGLAVLVFVLARYLPNLPLTPLALVYPILFLIYALNARSASNSNRVASMIVFFIFPACLLTVWLIKKAVESKAWRKRLRIWVISSAIILAPFIIPSALGFNPVKTSFNQKDGTQSLEYLNQYSLWSFLVLALVVCLYIGYRQNDIWTTLMLSIPLAIPVVGISEFYSIFTPEEGRTNGGFGSPNPILFSWFWVLLGASYFILFCGVLSNWVIKRYLPKITLGRLKIEPIRGAGINPAYVIQQERSQLITSMGEDKFHQLWEERHRKTKAALVKIIIFLAVVFVVSFFLPVLLPMDIDA